MSLQLMQMLSTTIEAKDEYTKGHSHRVAEYSVLIARELGWNEKELNNLKMLLIFMISAKLLFLIPF